VIVSSSDGFCSPVGTTGTVVVSPTSIAIEIDACWVVASTEGSLPESKTGGNAGTFTVLSLENSLILVLCIASVDMASAYSNLCNEDGFVYPSFSKSETSIFGVVHFCAGRDTGVIVLEGTYSILDNAELVSFITSF
jgi:hypothetical protein